MDMEEDLYLRPTGMTAEQMKHVN